MRISGYVTRAAFVGYLELKQAWARECPRSVVPKPPWWDGWSWNGCGLRDPGLCHTWKFLVGLLD